MRFAFFPLIALITCIVLSFTQNGVEFSAVVFCVFVLPAIIIHVSYLMDDWNTEVVIDRKKNCLVLKGSKEVSEIPFGDVKSIRVMGFLPILKWKIPWQHYYYTTFNLNNGDRIRISCLVMDSWYTDWRFICEDVETQVSLFPV